MLSNTSCRYSKKNFDEYIFSLKKWSAPVMVSPEEIREQIDSFCLLGRKVERMKLVGLSYFHTRDWIEKTASQRMKNFPEDERKCKSNYNNLDLNMQFHRSAITDKPLLIELEGAEAFVIYTPKETEFRMSMNRKPWWIDEETNPSNVDADILFAPCIGQGISAVEVKTYITDKDPIIGVAFDEPPYQREFVSGIKIIFENGPSLQIGPCLDYCKIDCLAPDGKPKQIAFSELKQALFNWEDLHDDEVTGFQAESGTIFFGKKGAKRASHPYMSLYSTSTENSDLKISVEDFVLLDWCITHATGYWFDEYGDYRFNYNEWFAILEEANNLLRMETFDDLFDELLKWELPHESETGCMLWKLNRFGAAFWNEREWYRRQLKDIELWSKLVLNTNDTMNISGF